VEFQSVADAVECAAEIQRRMARAQHGRISGAVDSVPDRINLGDVIVEDGISLAMASMCGAPQELAAPNGICVSAAVRDQVGDRLDVAFEDLGEQNVKNIVRPFASSVS